MFRSFQNKATSIIAKTAPLVNHIRAKNVHTGDIEKGASLVSERQYLLQHMLYLSSKLSEAASEKERQNLEQALLFYAKELRKLEARDTRSYVQ